MNYVQISCKSKGHHTTLHVDYVKAHGGERVAVNGSVSKNSDGMVSTKCTQICGSKYKGKSCAKTLLVKVYPEGRPDLAIRCYTIIDDQSNGTLARGKLFDLMGIDSPSEDYYLMSCSGSVRTNGRKASGVIVESLDGSTALKLPVGNVMRFQIYEKKYLLQR